MVDSAEQQETSIHRRSIAMNIQEIYKKMCDGEEVEFSVVEFDEDRQKRAGCAKKLLCRLRQDDMTVLLRVHPVKPLEPFYFTGTSIKLNISFPEGFIDLKINPSFSQVLLDCDKGGDVVEVKFMLNNSKSKSFIYRIYGGNITEYRFRHPLVSCKKEYQYEGENIYADFSFQLGDQRVKVDLSNEIDLDSFVHRKILDEISVLIEMISFCKSSAVKLKTEQAMSEENIVYERYVKHRVQDSGFANVICPMRSSDDMWISFLQHVWQKEDVTYSWLIDSGLFQAIGNLYFDNINEWVLIKLAAALEGLCKISEHSPIDNDRYKDIVECLLICSLDEIECQREFCDISNETIKQIKKNIENNKRTLNGYPTHWYVVKTLDELKLKNFRKKHAWRIKKAFDMRNTIVHTGWAKKWEVELIEHIKTLRSTIFLIVLARLEYPGKFYLSGHEHKETTSLQEWRS